MKKVRAWNLSLVWILCNILQGAATSPTRVATPLARSCFNHLLYSFINTYKDNLEFFSPQINGHLPSRWPGWWWSTKILSRLSMFSALLEALFHAGLRSISKVVPVQQHGSDSTIGRMNTHLAVSSQGQGRRAKESIKHFFSAPLFEVWYLFFNSLLDLRHRWSSQQAGLWETCIQCSHYEKCQTKRESRDAEGEWQRKGEAVQVYDASLHHMFVISLQDSFQRFSRLSCGCKIAGWTSPCSQRKEITLDSMNSDGHENPREKKWWWAEWNIALGIENLFIPYSKSSLESERGRDIWVTFLGCVQEDSARVDCFFSCITKWNKCVFSPLWLPN